LLLALAAVPALGATGYLGLLTLLSARGRPKESREPHLRFDVVIPAHEEEDGIAATVASALAIDYPRELLRIVVVADNCTDQTAARAEAAGAQVLIRNDPEHRGKGYALALAFEQCFAHDCDAVVVIDADTLVSSNLLRAFAARVDAGARAVQADYAVRNPDASWRTRLMAIALGMFHVLRSRARERMGVSCGLRGNGMCFTSSLLREVPHDAFSIVEDLEFGIRLGEAGHRVHYADEAHVYGEMVSSERASRSQRERWEKGRAQMRRRHGFRLLKRAVLGRDRLLFDLAIDVLMPPLSTLAGVTVLGLGAAAAVHIWAGGASLALGLWGACAGFLVLYGVRGWQLSGTGLRGLVSLFYAPVYLVWKLTLPFRRSTGPAGEWVRTTRERRTPP
jgi:1,2-diacylglycerol 3-beta-glucosyltransferase